MSFAGGADCFNVADLLASGMRTVTVCSDLLKSGGYLRMLQYPEKVDAAYDEVGAADTADFIRRKAQAAGFTGDGADVPACALFNLRRYADGVRADWRYRKDSFRMDRSKTPRTLDTFDCIAAPCLDECPVDQQVPRYMAAVRSGDVREAVRITRLDNPLPTILGRVCDHLCENTCIRTHLDQPLAIRQIKRFIMEQEQAGLPTPPPSGPAKDARVAIIGAGPGRPRGRRVAGPRGHPASRSSRPIPTPAAWWPGRSRPIGCRRRRSTRTSPSSSAWAWRSDTGKRAGVDFMLDDLRGEGFGQVFIAVGAQKAKTLGLPGDDCPRRDRRRDIPAQRP